MDTVSDGGQIIKKTRPGRPSAYGAEDQTKYIRRKFNAYITEDEIKAIVASAVSEAMNGKWEMQRYILDQIFGRAKQSVQLEDPNGNALQFILAEVIANKNVIQISNANTERTDTHSETE